MKGQSGSRHEEIKNLVGAPIVGTAQLEKLWHSYGGKETLPKNSLKLLLKELTKKMRMNVSDSTLDEWIEECRSVTDDDHLEISFVQFKRLYLQSLLSKRGRTTNLTESLQVLIPNTEHKVNQSIHICKYKKKRILTFSFIDIWRIIKNSDNINRSNWNNATICKTIISFHKPRRINKDTGHL